MRLQGLSCACANYLRTIIEDIDEHYYDWNSCVNLLVGFAGLTHASLIDTCASNDDWIIGE